MKRERVIEILREHAAELKAAGLLHLRLFGSVAREEATAESDIDLLFTSDDSDLHTLLRAYGYQQEVSELLGLPAHLSCDKHMRPEVLQHVMPETIDVY